MKTIGIIGYGNMGSALYRYLEKEGYQLLVYDPYFLESKNINIVSNVEILENESNILIISVKPDQVSSVLSSLKQENKKIFSIAAGVKMETIKKYSPNKSIIIRLMPNLPLVVGEGCIGYYGDEEGFEDVESIFSKVGKTFCLKSESLIDAFTGIAGSGPAYVCSFVNALAEGGVLSGVSYKEALLWSIQMIKGSVLLLEKEIQENEDYHPGVLKSKVSSPGGTTIEGLKNLEKGNFHFTVMNSVYKAYNRAKELG